jgi:hypothetical protein
MFGRREISNKNFGGKDYEPEKTLEGKIKRKVSILGEDRLTVWSPATG